MSNYAKLYDRLSEDRCFREDRKLRADVLAALSDLIEEVDCLSIHYNKSKVRIAELEAQKALEEQLSRNNGIVN